ncbi:RDD family protein [Galbibacter sp. EGI 63066]|uniref:RDD family protein n=1 Tax=Galbibacter sp. EGI 63066 TaxID=2993559 RepID=UPI002248B3A7|nr:RDD family protein [Galbibacter sp. EGI 63066]MCX2680072.1 RDD family protein [Galbibacter sp. EGI 63066]
MTRQLINRILAWTIDFGIIVLYAVLLFTLTSLFFEFKQASLNPYFGQLIGFLTLTLPVIAYSYLTEKSKWKATIGKRILNLMVLNRENKTFKSVLLRNLLKYLPWELAHTGVHWMIYFESVGRETPIWTWVILIVPQIMVFIYFVSIVISKGQGGIYDRISGTRLQLKTT